MCISIVSPTDFGLDIKRTHSRSLNIMMKKTLVKRRTAEKMTANRNSLCATRSISLEMLEVVSTWVRRPVKPSGQANTSREWLRKADHASPDILRLLYGCESALRESATFDDLGVKSSSPSCLQINLRQTRTQKDDRRPVASASTVGNIDIYTGY